MLRDTVSTRKNDESAPSNVLNLYVQSVTDRDSALNAGDSERHQLSSLSVDEVSEWLGIVRCSVFAVPFANRRIGGRALEALTEEKLAAMNVGTPAQRQKLLKYIRQASRRKINLTSSPQHSGKKRANTSAAAAPEQDEEEKAALRALEAPAPRRSSQAPHRSRKSKNKHKSKRMDPASQKQQQERPAKYSGVKLAPAPLLPSGQTSRSLYQQKDRAIQDKLDALLADSDAGRSVSAARRTPSHYGADPRTGPSKAVLAAKVDRAAAQRQSAQLQRKTENLQEALTHHPNGPRDDEDSGVLNRRLLLSNQKNRELQRRIGDREAAARKQEAKERQMRADLHREQQEKHDLAHRFAEYSFNDVATALDADADAERSALEDNVAHLEEELAATRRQNQELHRVATDRLGLHLPSDDGAPRTLDVHGVAYVRADLDPQDAVHDLRSMTERAWVLASKRLSEADSEIERVQAAHSGLKRQLDAQIEAGKDSAASLEARQRSVDAAEGDLRELENRLRVEEAKLHSANEALEDMRQQFDNVQADRIRLLGDVTRREGETAVARALGATAQQLQSLLAAKTAQLSTEHQRIVTNLRQKLQHAQKARDDAARNLHEKQLQDSSHAKQLTVLRVYVQDQERLLADLRAQSEARERRVRFLEEERRHIHDSPAAQLIKVKQLLQSEERASTDLGQKVHDLTRHVHLLQDQLTQQNASGSVLEQRLADRDRLVGQLRSVLQQKSLANESLAATHAETTDQLERTKKLLNETRDNLEASQSENRHLRADLQQAQSDRELALLAKIAAEKALPHAQERLEEARARCYELETRLLAESTRRADLLEVSERAAAAEGDNSRQRSTISELNAEASENRAKLAELLQENHRLRNRLARNENAVLTAQREQQATEEHLVKVKGQLAAERQRKQAGIVYSEGLTEKLETARARENDLQAELTAVRLALEQARKTADQTQRTLAHQNQFLQDRNNELQKTQQQQKQAPFASRRSQTVTRVTTTTTNHATHHGSNAPIRPANVDTGGIGRQTLTPGTRTEHDEGKDALSVDAVAGPGHIEADGDETQPQSDVNTSRAAESQLDLVDFDPGDDLSMELPPVAAIPGALNDDDDVTAAPAVRLQKLKLAQDRRLVQDVAQNTAVEQQLRHLQVCQQSAMSRVYPFQFSFLCFT